MYWALERLQKIVGTHRLLENTKTYSAHWNYILNLKGIKEDELERAGQLIEKKR